MLFTDNLEKNHCKITGMLEKLTIKVSKFGRTFWSMSPRKWALNLETNQNERTTTRIPVVLYSIAEHSMPQLSNNRQQTYLLSRARFLSNPDAMLPALLPLRISANTQVNNLNNRFVDSTVRFSSREGTQTQICLCGDFVIEILLHFCHIFVFVWSAQIFFGLDLSMSCF